jgi:threonine synthase
MGPPGTGKTLTGKSLGKILNRPVIDIDDDWLEPLWGVSVASKLTELGTKNSICYSSLKQGDEGFLRAEGEALMKFPEDKKHCIVCLTGSNPLHSEAMEHISKDSVLVYLDTPLDTIENRMHKMKVDRIVGQSTSSLKDILKYRHNFYENGYHVRIMTSDGDDIDEIAHRVVAELSKDQNYRSTRGWCAKDNDTEFLDVIRMGLAPDRGLFVAPSWTSFTIPQLGQMVDLPYQERVLRVFEKFPLGSGCPPSLLRKLINEGYSTFDHPLVLPVTHLEGDLHLMEMYHGPTASFKDLSLQFTPKLLTLAVSRAPEDAQKKVGLLVATSGDTGTAALDGFGREKDVPVIVLYPKDGVSTIQKAQMITAPKNTRVIAVDSDFDYCQTLVKDILEDQEALLGQDLGDVQLTSANSINFGRFLPQVVFTVSSYLELVKQGKIVLGQEMDVTVPTGNFGNILGVIFARRLGVPIGKLICASNTNNILTEFLATGRYDLTNRNFVKTMSPSIDILISSNVERFVYLLYREAGRSEEETGRIVADLFATLSEIGFFVLPEDVRAAMKKELVGGWCSEDECRETIRGVKERTGIILDPHTAVAKFVADKYVRQGVPMLIASTASFAKFPEAIFDSLGIPQLPKNATLAELFGKLGDDTNVIPRSLRSLVDKPVNQNTEAPADKNQILEHIRTYLKNAI